MSDQQAEYLIDVIRNRFPLLSDTTVPAGATCGGCRWWASDKYCNPVGDLGTCYIEPEMAKRMQHSMACRHYQEAAK